MTFLGDEGRDVLIAKHILEGHLVFLGPRSSAADFFYGPVYYYFITPFLLLFNFDPIGPAFAIAILGILTVYLIYFVAKDFFGQKAALFAAGLYAVSPLVIAYSRSSWNPNPLPFVSLLLLYLLYKAIVKKSWKLFVSVGILYGIAMQLQYIVLFLGVIIFLYVLIGDWLENKKIDIKALVVSYSQIVFGFLISFSPFLAFEIKNHFPNTKTIINFLISGPDKTQQIAKPFVDIILGAFFQLFSRLLLRFPSTQKLSMYGNTEVALWQIGTILLIFAGIAALFKIKNKPVLLLFSLWLFLSLFLFGFYKKEIYDYYLGFMFPLPFLLIGNSLSALWDLKKIKVIGVFISLVVFISLFLYNLDGMPFKSLPNRQRYQVENIADFVLSKTDNKPYNFALLTLGNSDHAYRYFFEVKRHPPVMFENIEKDPQRKTVANQLLVVCEDPNCKPLGNPLFEVSGFGRAEIVGEWNVSVVKVYKLKHYIGP